MENIAPPLKLLWAVKKSIDRGASVRAGLKDYLEADHDSWKDEVLHWSIRVQQGLETYSLLDLQKTPYRQQLLALIERGLKGEAIYPQLIQVEKEMLELTEQQIDEFVARLPYLLLVPLALFLFPACLILMLGPLILQLTQSF